MSPVPTQKPSLSLGRDGFVFHLLSPFGFSAILFALTGLIIIVVKIIVLVVEFLVVFEIVKIIVLVVKFFVVF